MIPSELKEDNELVICVSGGKDSTAMALWLRFESGLKNRMLLLCCDTGHEHPETIKHVYALADRVELPLHVVRGQRTFLELCEHKQRFPSTMARFCTEELKVYPTSEFLEDQYGRGNLNAPVLCHGIRRQESVRRSKLPRWDKNEKREKGRRVFECPIWRPILEWSAADVFEAHGRHGFEPNPLYKLGAKRVGCWPCIMSSKSDIRACFEADPGLLDRLREMERSVSSASARGSSSFFSSNKTPHEFHDREFIAKDGSLHSYASIDGVYRWAMGDANQSGLFDNDEDPPTCWSHYGLCE